MKPKKYQEVETEIKEYYRNLSKLDWLHRKIDLFQKQKNEIIADMENSNISLSCNIQGVSYDSPVVQTSGNSGLDKMIDVTYDKMEKELEIINQKIIHTKAEVRLLEEKNAKLEFCVKLLSEDAKSFLELYYHQKKKSYVDIGLELNVSHTTVGRLKKEVLQQLSLLFNYLKT